VVAFVVRRDTPVAVVDLGPQQPIAAAIGRWRDRYAGAAGGAAPGQADPAARLRRLLWEPLEKRLNGVRTLLVSPDGALAAFPLAALPGSRPGSYLIEDLAVAVVPVPQLVAAYARPAGTDGQETPSPSLLLVGDVDYDARPAPGEILAEATAARRATRSGAGLHFAPLAGTAAEVTTVGRLFRQAYPAGTAAELCRALASKAAVRARAAGNDYLHLATHGFFAPPELRSVLAGDEEFTADVHPGLLSGLALAGINSDSEPTSTGSASPGAGILTALEAAELDLGAVDLVVLSACETGLGRVAGGEGLLGLQRAFQVAGARTVVGSLWKLDDAATQLFMAEFYENLWLKKRGKLEALRQAQLAMLRAGDPQRGILRGAGKRVPIDPAALARAREVLRAQEHGQLPPFFWAGFVLSGDWR
jgi:CHAT domain-containing protein